MIVWPPNLVDDIARRKCVLVIGAGVSKNSQNAQNNRPKDWKEFLENASLGLQIKSEVKKQINSGDYLTACELIKKELGRDDFNDLVRGEFMTPQFQPAEIHKHIYNLDSRIVITPNFDKIYDTYASTASYGSVAVKKFYDTDVADYVRGVDPFIIKIHGSVETPDNLIFTRKDYSEARTKHRDFYHIVDSLAVTHTFIFIGCGTNDPDIRLILENYTFQFAHNRKHYIIMPRNEMHPKVQEIVGETMSLKPLLYDSRDYHKILTTSLEELVAQVEIRRQELSSIMKW